MVENFYLTSGWRGLEQGAEFYRGSRHRFFDAIKRGEVLGAHKESEYKYVDGHLIMKTKWCGYPGGVVGPVASEQIIIVPKNTVGIREVKALPGEISGSVVAKQLTPAKGTAYSRVTLASLPVSGVVAQLDLLVCENDESGNPQFVPISEYWA